MLLLTVTTDTQGRRRTDSCTAIDGELVTLAETSDCDQYEPDSPYPRAFEGLSSGALTTTAVVRDVPLSETDLRLAVRGFLEAHHPWQVKRAEDEEELEDVITAWTTQIHELVGTFRAGTVLERWWDTLSARGSGPLGREQPPGRRRASW